MQVRIIALTLIAGFLSFVAALDVLWGQARTVSDIIAQSFKANAELKVVVSNRAQLATALLASAEGTVGRVLQAAGVRVLWIHCDGVSAHTNPGECFNPVTPDRLEIVLLPECKKPSALCDISTFAAVITPDQPSSFPYRADVFWHEIDSFAVDSKIRSAALLGHVIAHEMGHLLLGSNSHAESGIMKANWRLKELVLVAQGRMMFNNSDAIRLRRSIVERNGAPAKPPTLSIADGSWTTTRNRREVPRRSPMVPCRVGSGR